MNEKRYIENTIHVLTGCIQACPDRDRDATYRSIQLLLMKLWGEVEPDDVSDMFGEIPQDPQLPEPIPEQAPYVSPGEQRVQRLEADRQASIRYAPGLDPRKQGGLL